MSAPSPPGQRHVPARPGPARVEAFGVAGIGEVSPGDDLAAVVVAALEESGESLRDGDVVVVSSKVVSKAEGRTMAATDRSPAIDAETVRVVAERVTPRGLTRIAEARSGPVLAAAGVDASNVAPGTVLLLPADPDGSARALRSRLADLTGARVGVVVSDTAGRPWRDGQVDIAIGAAGIAVVDDLRGAVDAHGQPLEVTVRALADELASLGDLVKGKLSGVPAAVVRGLGDTVADGDGPGAATLLRRPDEDWFRFGHVEAVRAAVGLRPGAPGAPGMPPPSVPPGTVAERFARVLTVAFATPFSVPLPDAEQATFPLHHQITGDAVEVQVLPTEDGFTPDEYLAAAASLGALAEVIRALAWTEDLQVTAAMVPLHSTGGMPAVVAVAQDAATAR